MATNPKPITNVTHLPSVQSNQHAWPNYQSAWSYPTAYWYQAPDPDAGRLRFALELIAKGDITKDVMEKIAKSALRENGKKS